MIARDICGELIRAKKPLFIFGAGARVEEARALAEMTGIPICSTWGARDYFPNSVAFGTHGMPYANQAVQTADYILCVGARLDTKATAAPKTFAPNAKLVMVDIDPAELSKMAEIGRPLYRAIQSDANEFLSLLNVQVCGIKCHDGYFPAWKIEGEVETHGAYGYIKELANHLTADDTIVCDTGLSLAWMMRAYPFKGERFLHSFNQTPMGYGLPGAIGAAFAAFGRVVLVCGDGGFSVNITELATICGHRLDIKIILFENRSHSMCTQTERQWFNGMNHGTTEQSGLSFPNFDNVVNAYGIKVSKSFGDLFVGNLPSFLRIPVDPEQGVEGQIKAGGSLLEV